MKRCIAATLVLGMLVSVIAGCKQHCFISEKCFREAHAQLLPANVESGDPAACVNPLIPAVAAPPNVDQPDRPPRFLTLQEAIAIALENGATGGRTGAGTGLVDDNLLNFTGGGLASQTDRIRVLALNPAIAGATIEANLARFDALWINSMNWTKTDNLQQGLSSFNNGDRATFLTGLTKLMPSGGVAHVGWQNDYTLLSNPPTGTLGVINPNYTSRVTIGIEQPLLRYFGTEINQLLQRAAPINGVTIPRDISATYNNQQSVLSSSVAGQPIEGILLARLRFDQQRAEFERQVQLLVLNVEVAYWNLYQAYGRLYSFEEVMRIAHKSWMMNYAKFQAGTVKPGEFYPIRGQYEEFRGERMAALGAVLERERNLRGILGLPVEDGTRLVPVTPPTLAPYRPDWEVALSDALNQRPELVLARENLRAQQLALLREKNLLKPDLRLFAQYSPVGFGTRLDGDGTMNEILGQNADGSLNSRLRTNNALKSLFSDHYNDWTVGATLAVPLGFRFEHASVRSARLQLAQSYYLLKDQEERATRVLTNQYQKIAEWYRLIETRRAERKAYADAVEARFREMAAGKPVIEFLLEAQRRLAVAQVKEYEAIAEYNNSLVRFEWAKGSILQHDNVVIAEGSLPQCCQVRAVEHEKERTKAYILRERPEPMSHPAWLAGDQNLPDTLDANGKQGPPNPDGFPPQPKKLPENIKNGNSAPVAGKPSPVVPNVQAPAKVDAKQPAKADGRPGQSLPQEKAEKKPADQRSLETRPVDKAIKPAVEELPIPKTAEDTPMFKEAPRTLPAASGDGKNNPALPEFKPSSNGGVTGTKEKTKSEPLPQAVPGLTPPPLPGVPSGPPDLPELPALPPLSGTSNAAPLSPVIPASSPPTSSPMPAPTTTTPPTSPATSAPPLPFPIPEAAGPLAPVP